MWLILVAVMVVLVTWLLATCFRRPENYPPGPRRFPVIGQAFAMDRMQPQKTMDQWVTQYGPVFSVKLGVRELVVLSSPDLIRETFSRPEVSARPVSIPFLLPYDGSYGIINSSGNLWMENRRFTIRHLKDFGVGTSAIEDRVKDQIQEMMDRQFTPKLGHSIDITHILNITILNIIWTVVSGETLKYDDKKIEYFLDVTNKLEKNINKAALLDFFPWLSFVVPECVFNQKQLADSVKDFHQNTKRLIEEHRTTLDHSYMRDYMDCYLKKIDESKTNSESPFFEWQLISNIIDLFVAGGETTATTLRWAFLFLCRYPQHQRKLQQEIENVIGDNRLPEFRDKDRMPFMEAFIAEVQRLGNIAPIGLPHCTDRDTIIAGYNIPKDTRLIALLYHVHFDPALWKNPKKFDPMRFLNADGKFVKNNNLMPFLVGRRQCPGESLARVELFLFLTSLLQRFSFRFPESQTVGEEALANGKIISEPQPYQLIASLRRE